MKVKELLKHQGPRVLQHHQHRHAADSGQADGGMQHRRASCHGPRVAGGHRHRARYRQERRQRTARNARTCKIKDVMSTNLLVVKPGDDLDYVMAIMIQNNIRHTAGHRGERPGGPLVHARRGAGAGEEPEGGEPLSEGYDRRQIRSVSADLKLKQGGMPEEEQVTYRMLSVSSS